MIFGLCRFRVYSTSQCGRGKTAWYCSNRRSLSHNAIGSRGLAVCGLTYGFTTKLKVSADILLQNVGRGDKGYFDSEERRY